MREFTVKNENDRFDKYLLRLLPMASPGFIYKMLRKKNILLNGKKATGKELLKKGDTINIYFSEDTFAKFEGKDILRENFEKLSDIPCKSLEIVYEDDEKIIINKPFGTLSQKSTRDDISVNEIIISYLISQGLSFEDFCEYKPSVLNRLDRNTGGLIMAAKTRKAAQNLTMQIKEKSIRRKYLAIVHGVCDFKGEYKAGYIKDSEKNTATILASSEDGEDIIKTVFNTLKTDKAKSVSLISCELLTGKSHQIRAMTGFLGHPIINDTKYGDIKKDRMLFKKGPSLPGQYLFAREIIFPDGLTVTVDEPEAFKEII